MKFDMRIDNPIRLGMKDEQLEHDFYKVLNAATDKFGYKKVRRKELSDFFLKNGIDMYHLPNYLFAMIPSDYLN